MTGCWNAILMPKCAISTAKLASRRNGCFDYRIPANAPGTLVDFSTFTPTPAVKGRLLWIPYSWMRQFADGWMLAAR
jgi:hypothetical protein